MSRVGKSGSGRKKRLGQYFTDEKVGRLLAALAEASSARTIIDPMVGTANLLQACLSIGSNPDRIVGIELDQLAFRQAQKVLDGVRNADLILGDAFNSALPDSQFDLVITNPPYIRYQSNSLIDDIELPSNTAVRSGLIRAINARPSISEEEKALLLRAARRYPGTSDIAVPAWILSAALVRENGILAIIVPQAWMSRNYAQPVRELLDELFSVECIVEDGDASWFSDAQVRTQLVVARKRKSPLSRSPQRTVIARADRNLEVNGSLCGSLGSEKAVATALRDVDSRSPELVTNGLSAHLEYALDFLSRGEVLELPNRVASAIGATVGSIPLRTLASYGWKTGQGLRSGANDFFYVEALDGSVYPAARWGTHSLPIPSECLLPAVRRQSDLDTTYGVNPAKLRSFIVSFKGWVTESDLERMGGSGASVLPDSVSRWISQVSQAPLSAKHPNKLFPDLSAVATNERTDNSGRPVRFWYQLPDFAPRHRPAIFLARVCGGRTKAYLNNPRIIVDANFSGLWPVSDDALPTTAVLALLNSTWTWVNLESICTVLGGGALKVEATDLRRLVFPELSASAVQRLADLGQALVDNWSESVPDSIDEVISESLRFASAEVEPARNLRALAERYIKNRVPI